MSSAIASAFDAFPSKYLSANGVRLHYVDAGEGPLVVLIHGFPEFSYSWRRQIPALVNAGYRVVAPDMRGYNLSDKPEGARAYQIGLLVEDVAALIHECGAPRAAVVGHDWGAGVAWAFAMKHPELLERLAVLNGPHPERMIRGMKSLEQLAKSWYVFLFQLPWLPEQLAQLDDFAMLVNPFREDPVVPGAFDAEDLARYRAAFAQPGALTAMINYYRGMLRPGGSAKVEPIDAPVLIIWGEKDRYLGRDLAVPDPALVPHARVEYVPNATHWVQHEQPETVNALLTAFLRENGAR